MAQTVVAVALAFGCLVEPHLARFDQTATKLYPSHYPGFAGIWR